ncbi:NADH dehydrogenase [Aureimonas sp. SA4125]|uniref:NAD(P)/FAD-dependent oxidoreductase n=1 Tax=Aureimonas sp. SA4125 TaxID=2826993 RepID=UPI001CC77F9B|nr:FAD-dependent oxidoreductase [Aureimonas sp. SA4125]BDA82573.1 NADH dehydrogenase [Aureimonas sp. SA4125]
MAATRIVILGGGAGGLELASALSSRPELDVTLVDRVGAHIWKPRLHEFAAGTVTSTLSEISFYMLAQMRGFRFEQGSVVGIDRAASEVRLAAPDLPGTVGSERRIGYDRCVVALGGITADFGIPGVREHAIRLDAKLDADAFRDRFVALLINARQTRVPARVVIVGSGATGTELAAHLRLAETAFFDRPETTEQPRLLDLTLLEAAPEVMPGADAELRAGVVQRLAELGVTVVTSARITAVEPGAVRAASGGHWPADLTVWAAGLVGLPVLSMLADFEMDRKGRIVVDAFLRSTVDPAVYALGDAASLTPDGAAQPLPPTAQIASQQAAYLASSLADPVAAKPFRFKDKGKLVSLGGAGTVGLVGFHRNDFFVDGQFAKAAYHALQRRHQWQVLGPLRGSVAILADVISPTRGPALKLHG